MKKFKFSLEKVLQLKQQILKNLKNDLASLQFQLRQKEQEIEALKKKYLDTDNIYKNKSAASILPYEIKFYKDYLNSLLAKIKKSEEDKQLIIKKVELKKQEIINLNIEISSIEKLKEKKVEVYNKELQKMEELFIEEFVSNSTSTNLQK